MQTAEHLAKRKELWSARQESGATCTTLTGRGNQVVQVAPPEIGYKLPPAQKQGLGADTEEKTGAAERVVGGAARKWEKFSHFNRSRKESGSSFTTLIGYKLPPARRKSGGTSCSTKPGY